jgi:hypothetical protein
MGERRRFTVFGFHSVHEALEAEAVLKQSGITSIAIPSPRELGELCGIALRVEMEHAPAAREALEAAGRLPLATAEIIDR